VTVRSFRMLASALFACFIASVTLAQHDPAADAGAQDGGAESAEGVARESPRASISNFLTHARAGQYGEAAAYLELARADEPKREELARKLLAVLDRRAWIDLETLSPLPSGNAEDGLPPFTEQLGEITGPDGAAVPIRIVRRRSDGVRWMFTAGTVAHVEAWYQQLDNLFVLEHLPEPLLATGPHHLMWWQWLALPLLIAISWGIAHVLAHISALVLARIARRSMATWDDLVVERIKRPLTLWWALGLIYLLLPWLALYVPAQKFVLGAMRTVFLFGVFWALSRAIDVAAHAIVTSPWARTREASRSLVSLGSRVTKVAVFAVGVIALLSQLGYPIASVLAGLGVGGLAVALAAQKTVENLFGAFSIGADQPFREGDFVRVDDMLGTVERIGLRSTKFRTAERTVVSIPNGKLADMRIETFAARDRLRLAMTVALIRSTSSKQLKQIVEGIEGALWTQPKLFPGSAAVRFEKFGPSSLDVDVVAYFDTRDVAEFQQIRQELLFDFLAAIERAGSALALPATQVVMMPKAEDATRPNSETRS
jgi:MscS family membrane protein